MVFLCRYSRRTTSPPPRWSKWQTKWKKLGSVRHSRSNILGGIHKDNELWRLGDNDFDLKMQLDSPHLRKYKLSKTMVVFFPQVCAQQVQVEGQAEEALLRDQEQHNQNQVEEQEEHERRHRRPHETRVMRLRGISPPKINGYYCTSMRPRLWFKICSEVKTN